MFEMISLLATAVSALAGVTILSVAGLRAWNGWLDLQRAELTRAAPPGPAARIELADLRERVRKLEAIAAGIEL